MLSQSKNSLSVKIVACAFIFLAATTSAQTPAERGKSLMDDRKYNEAKAVLEPVGQRDAVASLYLGQIALEQNDPKKGVDWLERSVALDPRSSVAYDWLGRAYGEQARHASKFKLPSLAGKTRGAWERAIALDPNNLDARQDMILYFLQAPGFLGGGKDKARAMANEIAKRNAYRGAISWIRICSDAKDQPCVEKQLSLLVTSYPDSSASYSSLASFYTSNKQYDKAFSVIDERLKSKPTDASALYAYGRTSSISGLNLDRGEQSLKAYINAPVPTGPSVAHAHFRLGLIQEKRGDKVAAKREYQTALRIDPQNSEAKKALQALGG
ncbi:MAG: tetratricopeptide repeat protein [Gemmatimonadaceae bacterium]